MYKRFLTFVLALFMTISLMSTSATATAISGNGETFPEPKVTTSTKDGFTIAETVPMDLSSVSPSNIINLPNAKTSAQNIESTYAPKSSNDFNCPDFNASELENAIDMDAFRTNTENNRASSAYQLYTTSAVMQSNSEYEIYTVRVKGGDIVQAELQVPENMTLNYDLFLYVYNESADTLTMVSGSVYGTDSNFTPENVCAINNSSAERLYAIFVMTNGKPSTTDTYTLNVSIGGDFDDAEPNDSAFFAVKIPTITTQTTVARKISLHSPIDNDWFEAYFADTSEFGGVEIAGIPDSVIVEVYTLSNNVLTKVGSTEDVTVLPIKAGYNYFRVISNRRGTFKPETFDIKFSPAVNPEKIAIYIAVDGYCQRSSNLFDDNKTRYLFTISANVEVKVVYLTENDIPVRVNDTVSVVIANPLWTNDSMRFSTGYNSISNESTCSVFLKAPTTYGTSTYNLVYTTIYSQEYGTLFDMVEMALLNRYGDAETSRPCEHNGACGFL